MKSLTVMILAAVSMAVVGSSSIANEQTYIPWTFDDFNSNCDVIETAVVQWIELPAPAAENADDEEAGELGW